MSLTTSHFSRKEIESLWLSSEEQLNENYVVVQGLDPGFVYKFRVVAVDGKYETPSPTQDVQTYAKLPDAADRGGAVVGSSGWFIGRIHFFCFLRFTNLYDRKIIHVFCLHIFAP